MKAQDVLGYLVAIAALAIALAVVIGERLSAPTASERWEHKLLTGLDVLPSLGKAAEAKLASFQSAPPSAGSRVGALAMFGEVVYGGLEGTFNRLGAEGWERFDVSEQGVYIFKRTMR